MSKILKKDHLVYGSFHGINAPLTLPGNLTKALEHFICLGYIQCGEFLALVVAIGTRYPTMRHPYLPVLEPTRKGCWTGSRTDVAGQHRF